MKVEDLMSRHVEFIESDSLVKDAAVLMGELDVGALPVGSPERLEGIVTDRDILYRVVARGLDCSSVRVREIFSRPVVTCGEDDSLQTAMDVMASNHIRRMPVCGAGGAVTGWITLADLSRKLLIDSGTLQAALHDLTEIA
jgi:CBS domain-containing protein